jgi:hypothetical protein
VHPLASHESATSSDASTAILGERDCTSGSGGEGMLEMGLLARPWTWTWTWTWTSASLATGWFEMK